jgi:hypothetical protein
VWPAKITDENRGRRQDGPPADRESAGHVAFSASSTTNVLPTTTKIRSQASFYNLTKTSTGTLSWCLKRVRTKPETRARSASAASSRDRVQQLLQAAALCQSRRNGRLATGGTSLHALRFLHTLEQFMTTQTPSTQKGSTEKKG